MQHKVKSWTWLFESIVSGRKKHDLRDLRDRDYKVGDTLLLQEWDQVNGKYTGREKEVKITYITDNRTPCAFSSTVLAKEFGIFSIE